MSTVLLETLDTYANRYNKMNIEYCETTLLQSLYCVEYDSEVPLFSSHYLPPRFYVLSPSFGAALSGILL